MNKTEKQDLDLLILKVKGKIKQLEGRIEDLELLNSRLPADYFEIKKNLYPTEDNLGWSIDEKGEIMRVASVTNGTVLELMIKCFENNNWFPTKEEAEKELAKRKAVARVKKYIIDNNMYFKPVWRDY